MTRADRTKLAAVVALALGVVACHAPSSDATVQASPPAQRPGRFDLGAPVDSAHLAAIDIDVDPTGAHLPPGSGTPSKGFVVFVQYCARCHGAKGEGQGIYPRLVGRDPRQGFPFGKDANLVKTVGNYWPYSTTLYDYIHRAMPLTAPGSLKPDEVYSVVAWILAENEIVPKDAVIDAKSLPAVKMPAVNHFVIDDRKGTTVR